MAEWAQGRLRSTMALREPALTGPVRDHHRQVLTLQLAPSDCLNAQLDTLRVAMTPRLMARGPMIP